MGGKKDKKTLHHRLKGPYLSQREYKELSLIKVFDMTWYTVTEKEGSY